MQFLRTRSNLFGPYFVGFALCSTVGYGLLDWAPTFMARTHHWPAAKVGYSLGLTITVLGASGVLLGGVLATYWRRRGIKDAAFRTAT